MVLQWKGGHEDMSKKRQPGGIAEFTKFLRDAGISPEEALALLRGDDKGPTTVCSDCLDIVPAFDAYKSKVDGRIICEGCFREAERGGRAKVIDV